MVFFVNNEIEIISTIFRSWHKSDWNHCSIPIKNGQNEHYETICYTLDLSVYQTLIYVYEHTILHNSVQE